ncbi:response regulator [Geobacter sulfurreducens]|uniref:Response regulator, putative n=1 Tax=Geobacter sulfurreducens (strain ATCC 51573 / DSM 12127 / PCA) TaxID=243231 RepID=Q74GY9_GEOSL|nr:response regulator [Geobacter sulfurreducens]AAR33439.1 response regulator, putative [Geobacter sulfurreducens PCA]ADI82942.1 response regulator, putative [Geobacter sulfurreducens KN400]AJY69842.1 chemotaxis protein CheY [Geobacter sulfurreducens]QVW35383.1 response regulator [Geobacter sulfurreducens]UAC04207.1 response regulator [Geobacter sulfurreducens]
MDTKTILLVEDNPDDEFLALRALRRHGLQDVVVARDGEQAVGQLFEAAPPLDPWLVLLDLKLPKMNGLEVLRTIRSEERTRHTPVIVISSSQEETDVVKCRELGVLAYLTKPIDGEKIMALLATAGLSF